MKRRDAIRGIVGGLAGSVVPAKLFPDEPKVPPKKEVLGHGDDFELIRPQYLGNEAYATGYIIVKRPYHIADLYTAVVDLLDDPHWMDCEMPFHSYRYFRTGEMVVETSYFWSWVGQEHVAGVDQWKREKNPL